MKNSSVLTKVFLTVIATIFINSCERDNIENPLTSDLTGSWKVISFEDCET